VTTLNRNRHRIAELVERLSAEGYRCQTPEAAAANACISAGLTHRTVTDSGAAPFVAVDAHPSVDYMAFTAIEPATYRTPRLSGWRLWWHRTDGVDVFRDGDPVEIGTWCATLAEALDSARVWQNGGQQS
jgi:hypothetical protein